MAPSRILVVDDDQGNRFALSKVLTGLGYDVDVAEDGDSALELVRNHEYALAVLDYRMPGMDGVELYRRIHANQPDVVGVFLTAFTTIDTVFPAIEAGVTRVLSKPVDFNELIPIVQETIGKRSQPA
ncbi:MAG: response regulator [Planctomycetes bacterium]|nr:response regulator [Planctomycetota bacterium]